MPSRIVAACALLAVGWTATPAQAHGAHVDWNFVGKELVVVASFDDDVPVENGEVTLRGPSGQPVATGKTVATAYGSAQCRNQALTS